MTMTRRTCLTGAVSLTAGVAAAETLATQPGPFVTHHRGVFGGEAVSYRAVVAATVLRSAAGQPTASLVSTAYLREGVEAARRPVLFAFNGGPSTSSAVLHMAALGPKRILIAQDPSAPQPPPGLTDNPDAVLDVADVVLIDPAETGFSRILPGGGVGQFYSANGDAKSVADFIVQWRRDNGREASPAYVLGESYGTIRAALVAGQLAERTPLDGVFLFGQAVNMVETAQRAGNVISYATNLPALAAIAAYHRKATETFPDPASAVDAAYAWGMGEYLSALEKGQDLAPDARDRIARRLAALTGIEESYYLAHGLTITKTAFAKMLLKDEGRFLAAYDARYTAPVPPPGQKPHDPFDPIESAIDTMMKRYYVADLGVTLPMSDYRDIAPHSDDWTWSGTGGPGGPFLDYDYPAQLAKAFAANPRFRLLIGNGYYDLTTTIGPSRYLVARSGYPQDRVCLRQYVGGHMAYTHLPSLRAFCEDIRAWVTGGLPNRQS